MISARRSSVLALFAIAMGWLEAVVVVYIRGLLGWPPGAPMPPGEGVIAQLRQIPWILPTEQGREAATIVMLAAVAYLGASLWRGRLGAFLVLFGIWDITYYVALRVLVGWPRSLFEMDLLFLIPPHPWWYQPIWVPVAISCGMIVMGLRLLSSGDRHAVRVRALSRR